MPFLDIEETLADNNATVKRLENEWVLDWTFGQQRLGAIPEGRARETAAIFLYLHHRSVPAEVAHQLAISYVSQAS